MIRAKLCFVAEGISIDRETGQLTAYALIEDLVARSFPLFVQKLAFFCLWERGGADPQVVGAELSVTLNGQDLARQEIPIDFEQHLRNRCTMRLDTLTIAEPGTLIFRLTVPGHSTAEWVVEAVLTKSDAPSAARALYESQPVSLPVGAMITNRR